MGVNDREQEKKETRRAKAKEQRSRRRASNGTADYEAVDWNVIAALVAEMAKHQGAIRLSYTRDGGAYALGVYLGDDYATEYVRPSEDLETAIDEIAEAWLPDGGDGYVDVKTRLRKNGS